MSTGSDNRTAGHAGTVVLVTGFRAITSLDTNQFIEFNGFATQSLTFVPEAGTLLLLASGAVCLALYAGHRRRG